MAGLVEQLLQLRTEAEAALAQANTTSATEAWYAEFLGRKGKMTALLRDLGQLSREERPLVGKTANEVKTALEAALQERQPLRRRLPYCVIWLALSA